MTERPADHNAEMALTLTFLFVVLTTGIVFGLPFVLPDADFVRFLGIHYIYPLAGVVSLAVLLMRFRRRNFAVPPQTALACYALVLLCHFNLKMWAPHISPPRFDEAYFAIDTALRPLVDFAMAVRIGMAPLVPLDSMAYLYVFIALFYVSFAVQAICAPEHFREVALGVILFQALGAVAYMIAPALGPFIFEPGVEPTTTANQVAMMAFYKANVAGGGDYLRAFGQDHFVSGLGAMPSLHCGGAFLFLYYARRYVPWLAIPIAPMFVFLSIDAIANRWHYLVDLPAGIAVALLTIKLSAAIVDAPFAPSSIWQGWSPARRLLPGRKSPQTEPAS